MLLTLLKTSAVSHPAVLGVICFAVMFAAILQMLFGWYEKDWVAFGSGVICGITGLLFGVSAIYKLTNNVLVMDFWTDLLVFGNIICLFVIVLTTKGFNKTLGIIEARARKE